jgi:TRAP-type C4-dicarboxylate transport system permease small subunit
LIVRLERAAVAWTRRLALLGGWLLLFAAFATVVDALLRYFFSRPLPGTFEATELILAAIVFFGLPYVCVTDGNVSVDALTQRLRPRLQHVLIALNALLSAALLALIAYQMTHLAQEYWTTSRTTITARIPVFPFLVPVMVAAGLAALGFVVQALGALARVARPDLPPAPGTSGERV